MAKIKSLADLKKMSAQLHENVSLREKSDSPESCVQVKVAMATCGIASGAKEVMEFMIDAFDKRGISAIVTQTGCMSYCYAEPTIEVTKPGEAPRVFGFVDTAKADEIIERYIRKGELVDGIIDVNYKTVDEDIK